LLAEKAASKLAEKSATEFAEKKVRKTADRSRNLEAVANTTSGGQFKKLSNDLALLKRLYTAGLVSEVEFKNQQKQLLEETFRRSGPITKKAKQVQKAFNVPSNVVFGDYHALVIGINDYKYLTKLKTAIADAKAMTRVLRTKYGFKVTELYNPTRGDIIDALDDLRGNLKYKDNLLIYYAGHGWLDEKADQGFWLPYNARQNRRSNWISNGILTGTLKAMEAKHVMIVADSCYSGRLIRGTKISLKSPNYFAKIATKRARVVITSGGLEPVIDDSGNGHSPFTSAFLDILNGNEGVLDGNTVFNAIRRPVMLNSDQTPQFSDIRKAGHDGGDFLFVRRQ
jgi:hypothetical protein